MTLDPFSFKKFSKLHPARITFTLYARAAEWFARRFFDWTALEPVNGSWPSASNFSAEDTAVTPNQLGILLYFLRKTEYLDGTAVVEVGSYRGVTTSKLAGATRRVVYAVDPFIGYGGAQADYERFLVTTRDHPSVKHLKATSGEAVKVFSQPISFLFLDAVHDYVNTIHDIEAWSANLVPGGILAMHDTDNRAFAGTRLAAFRVAKRFRLVCHVPDLVVFERSYR